MGEAILAGIITSGYIESKDIAFYELDKNRINHIEKTYAVKCVKNIGEGVRYSEYLLLAVKPQNIKMSGKQLFFDYTFKSKGFYDVHFSIGNDLIATYTVRVEN